MEKKFVRLLLQEVINSKAKILVQYSWTRKENAYFLGDYVQVPQKVPLQIANDLMYIVNFFTQAKRNSFKLGLKQHGGI
jgi:hypothetical protein